MPKINNYMTIGALATLCKSLLANTSKFDEKQLVFMFQGIEFLVFAFMEGMKDGNLIYKIDAVKASMNKEKNNEKV